MNRFCGRFVLLAGLLVMAAGLLATPTLAAERLVLFDQGHGQRFLLSGSEPLGLSGLAAELRAQGLTPKPLSGEITSTSLRGVAALVISGPFQAITDQELAAIDGFLGKGGRLCVMLHIAEPAQPLLQRLGVAATRAPIMEQVNLVDQNPLSFKVVNFAKHRVTAGLTSFNVNGCWGLGNIAPTSQVLAWSSNQAWSDTNGDGKRGAAEPLATLGVLAGGGLGKGAYLVFGDDAIFQNQFLVGGNLALAKNLAGWLKGQ